MPTSLTRKLGSQSRRDVEQWWTTLSEEERSRLRDLRTPARVVVRFVEDADEPTSQDFYEYLINHEITLDDGTPLHICRAHPKAREALHAGRISKGFVCPLADPSCPMRALLDRAPGRDAAFEVRDDG